MYKLESDLVLFRKAFPGFAQQSIKQQWVFVHHAFSIFFGLNQPHQIDPAAAVISQKLIVEQYGCHKKFKKMNDRFKIFDFKNDSDRRNNMASRVFLNPEARRMINTYLIDETDFTDNPQKASHLLNISGARIRNIQGIKAIKAIDSEGRRRDNGVQLASALVPINREALIRFINELAEWQINFERGVKPPLPRLEGKTDEQVVSWLSMAQSQCRYLLQYSNAHNTPHGFVVLLYERTALGRYYGIGNRSGPHILDRLLRSYFPRHQAASGSPTDSS